MPPQAKPTAKSDDAPWRTTKAHRISFQLANGHLPQAVLHTCDNPPCVNPAHLKAGTQPDNLADMRAKGRQRTAPLRGERNPRARLTDRDVREIRRRAASGETQKSLGRAFGVRSNNIGFIVNRVTWRHVA